MFGVVHALLFVDAIGQGLQTNILDSGAFQRGSS